MNVESTDWTLLLAMCALLALGLIMIFSSSAIEAYRLAGEAPYFFQRQLTWVGVGFIGCFFAMLVPVDLLKNLTPALYILIFVCLLLVLIPFIGKESSGSRRWIDLGIITFQPSEPAKLIVVLTAALYLSRSELTEKNVIRDILAVCFLAGLQATLVVLEPDVSTAFQIFMLGVALLFLAGVAFRYLFLLLAGLTPLLGMIVFASGYRRARIISYLNPWSDPFDQGYQTLHLMKSISSGGWLGKGLGSGAHRFLPEPFTDSIVAVLGEELGLVGLALLLGLVFFLLFRGITISLQTSTPYLRLIGVGATTMIGLQAAMNMCVVTGLIPTTGVPMPFISYGGSSLVVNMGAVGLLLNISRRRGS